MIGRADRRGGTGRTRSRRRGWTGVIAVLALLGAACGDDGGDDSAGGGGDLDCDVMSVAEVADTLGVELDQVEELSEFGSCSYGTGDGQSHVPVVNVSLTEAGSTDDGPQLSFHDGTPVEVGDEGQVREDIGTLVALLGDQELRIDTFEEVGTDELVALGQELVTRLTG